MKVELLSQHEIQIQKKENIGSTFFSIVCSSGVQTPEKPLWSSVGSKYEIWKRVPQSSWMRLCTRHLVTESNCVSTASKLGIIWTLSFFITLANLLILILWSSTSVWLETDGQGHVSLQSRHSRQTRGSGRHIWWLAQCSVWVCKKRKARRKVLNPDHMTP